MRRRINAWWLLWVSIVPACNSQSGNRGGRLSEYQRAVAAESTAVAQSPDTVYRRRMADLYARVRAVRTDTLAQLFASLLRASAAEQPALRRRVPCEYYRITALHGQAAMRRAIARMNDSLERAGVDITRARDIALTGAGPAPAISERVCGRMLRSSVPDSLEYEPEPGNSSPP
jgi:hypothetical protein